MTKAKEALKKKESHIMNNKQYDAFHRVAKRIVDQSRGKMTMTEAKKELGKILEQADRRKENKK